MKNNFSKLSAVCIFAAAALSTGCSSWHNRDADERYNKSYSAPPQSRNESTSYNNGRRHQVSPPPDLVASGVVDPSALRSTNTEGTRRLTDLISPPPELVANGVADQNALNSGPYPSNTAVNREQIGQNSIGEYRTEAESGMYSASGAVIGSSAYDANRSISNDKKAERFGRSIVLDFDSSSADLSEPAKTKLRDAVSALGADNIRRVEVASWSDKGFPRSGGDLSKPDRDLADKRADNINDFLKHDLDLSFMRIRTYSMAESSNWLARMFRTDEAELKSVFSKENEAPMAREDFNSIINQGGPSRAVIILIRKH